MDVPDAPSYDSLVEELHRLLQAIEVTGYAILPRSNKALLQSIVEAAARIFGAGGSSIALLDEEKGELEFVVAYNVKGKDIVGMRIPSNHGLAGLVAMTGQPLAVSDVDQHPNWDREFAEETEYVPTSILTTPLLSGDKVIGVMQILDKQNAPSFGLQDIELLALFANQAALAIHQSQQVSQIQDALIEGLRRLASDDDEETQTPLEGALAGRMAEPSADLLGLADAFNNLAALGPAERRACLQIMNVFSQFRKRGSRTRLRL
jgi:GAF domain-containing protein